MEDDLPVLAAALQAGYLLLAAVERWADEHILRLDQPPGWLLDLSLTKSVDDAVGLLGRGWSESGTAAGGAGQSARLYLGFLYLLWERGGLPLAELLNRAGQHADTTECGVDCSAFYLLLNEIDGGGPTIPSSRPLADRVAERFAPFAPFAAEARAAAGRLPAR